MRRFTVTPKAAGGRLDVFLAEKLKVSRSQAQRWLKADQVTVNGDVCRANYVTEAGDQVRVIVPTASEPALTTPPDLPIVYEDDELIVIDKPAGIAVHPGNGRRAEATVADFARPRTTDPDADRPGVVHRLDRDTSGLLVLAKSAESKQGLQQLWQQRQVHKVYRLLVVGRVRPAEAVISLALDRDPAHPTRRRVMTGGKPATTRYRTLATYPGYTLIEAEPHTGRTHQLRVHFAALGHPVAGDIVYGPSQRPLGLARQFLHATALSFTTPSGKPLALTSPLPPDLQTVLERLEDAYN